jgi:hypothetical protein
MKLSAELNRPNFSKLALLMGLSLPGLGVPFKIEVLKKTVARRPLAAPWRQYVCCNCRNCRGLQPGMKMFLLKRCNSSANPVISRQARLRYLLYFSYSGFFWGCYGKLILMKHKLTDSTEGCCRFSSTRYWQP